MSKKKEKLDLSELHSLQKDTINTLQSFLDELEVLDESSKCEKICYWLTDYINYIQFEHVFDPKKNQKYKRGEIVKIHLGFRIGKEYGGVHFGIILDKNNSVNSPIVTIAPLTSIKKNKDLTKLRPSEINIGTEIFDLCLEKAKKQEDILTKRISEIRANILEKNVELAEIKNSTLDKVSHMKKLRFIKDKIEHFENDLNWCKTNLGYHKKLIDEILEMKEGTIVLANQISTFSKIRIKNPLNSHDSLSGIKVSNNTLNLIDAYVINNLTNSSFKK